MTGSAWIFIVLKIVMPRRAFALPVMAGHPAPASCGRSAITRAARPSHTVTRPGDSDVAVPPPFC